MRARPRALNHPNIVQIHDVVEESERASIVMEYIAGEDLASYLARNPEPDPAFTAHVMRAMASALDYTHSRGVVHRDIKPANVMLDASKTPKITDFGIARITEGATATKTGVVMGTVEYMAPEQVKGEKVDGRADQFSLGVVAYRMLTGKPLFEGQSLATMAYKIVNEAPATVRSHNGKLPPSVDPVMAKVLAKDPNARYPTCVEFASALETALTDPALADQGPMAGLALSVAVANVATGAAARTATMRLPDSAPTARTVQPAQRRSKAPMIAVAACGIAGVIAGAAIWKPWASKPAAPAVTQSAVAPADAPPATPVKSNPPAAPHTASSAAPKTPASTPTPPPVVETKAETPAEDAASDDGETLAPAKAPGGGRSQQAFDHGLELMRTKDYASAVVAFSQATGLSPKWGQAYQGLGNAHEALGQFDLALKDFTQAIEMNPRAPGFYTSRGHCYAAMNRDNLALEDFNSAIGVNAKAPHALAQRGELYLRRRQLQKALADLNAAIILMPKNAVAYHSRAAVKRELGDTAGARQDTQSANQIDAGKRLEN